MIRNMGLYLVILVSILFPVFSIAQGKPDAQQTEKLDATTKSTSKTSKAPAPAEGDKSACNTDCAHLCLEKGDSLPAMIGNDGVMFRLPNGTWCSMKSSK